MTVLAINLGMKFGTAYYIGVAGDKTKKGILVADTLGTLKNAWAKYRKIRLVLHQTFYFIGKDTNETIKVARRWAQNRIGSRTFYQEVSPIRIRKIRRWEQQLEYRHGRLLLT